MVKDKNGFDLCLNCGKPIPENAKRCLHCGADLTEMDDISLDEVKAVMDQLEESSPGMMQRLRVMARNFDTADAFVNAICIGECPECDSLEVESFEKVRGVKDTTKARCLTCGHIWCTACFLPLSDPKIDCGHWAFCNACAKDKECEYLENPLDCRKLGSWIEKEERRLTVQPKKPVKKKAKKKAKKATRKSPSKVKDSRLFTLDVYLVAGPIEEEFMEKNKVVCRTIQIRGDQTLEDLHNAIFDAYDRYDPHMYQFMIGGENMRDPESRIYVLPAELDDPFGEDEPAGTVEEPIGSLGLEVGEPFGYWFDFGDDWFHQINVVDIAEKAGRGKFPKITKRIGESPPQYPECEGDECDDDGGDWEDEEWDDDEE